MQDNINSRIRRNETNTTINKGINESVNSKKPYAYEEYDNSLWGGIQCISKSIERSTTLEMGLGFGIGAGVESGALNATLLAVPVRDEFILADDCKTNTTTKFAIGLDYAEMVGIGASAKCSAYNGKGDGYSWLMPDHRWDYEMGLTSKYANWSINNHEEDSHFMLSVGASLYLFVGADISLSFDVDEFIDEMGMRE